MTWNSQINKPSQDYSLLVLLPVASFSQFRALEGLFLAYTALFNGPYLSSCLMHCFRNLERCKDTIRWGPSKTSEANLVCVFVKTHFFKLILDCKKQIE